MERKFSLRPATSNGGSWRHPAMGNPGKTEEDLALAVLSALSIAGVHSAINPSVFTLLSFATHQEGRARALKGLWIGLAASTLASGAIYVVFKKAIPAIIAEITAIGLFGSGIWAINQEAPATIPAIEKQSTTESALHGAKYHQAVRTVPFRVR